MSADTERLWNAITTRNTREIVDQLRNAELTKRLRHEARDESRLLPWDERAANDAGQSVRGEL